MTQTGEHSHRPRVLVVEDSSDSREMLLHLLALEGFEPVGASDGAEGLRRARADQPDLIVTDLMMPNMTGSAMIEALRADDANANVPIIAMTAAGSGDARRAMSAGATAFVLKPLDIDTLVALCHALIPSGHASETRGAPGSVT